MFDIIFYFFIKSYIEKGYRVTENYCIFYNSIFTEDNENNYSEWKKLYDDILDSSKDYVD
jgi:hypothetical protein